eukprot:1910205-Amphidinium_carterae.1
MKLREEYEKDKGPIEDREDFRQAHEDKDSNAIQEIVYEYAKEYENEKHSGREESSRRTIRRKRHG